MEEQMALSNSQYDSIMRAYNRLQLERKHELDERTKEVYERIPAVREMNEEISSAAIRIRSRLWKPMIWAASCMGRRLCADGWKSRASGRIFYLGRQPQGSRCGSSLYRKSAD